MKRNILVFMTDHQRSDTIGMVQCGREVTPNLNRLAERGFRFDRAYDACPLCVPARTALATGIYPTKNGVVYNDWKGKTAGDYEPLHTILKRTGYCVGHVGVDHIKVRPSMREQGLDYFINQEDYELWARSQGLRTERNPEELLWVEEELDGAYVPKQYSGYQTTIWPGKTEQFKDFYFLERSLEFLRSVKDRPFALFTYLWAPHPPLKVPEPYAKMYDPAKVVLPNNIGVAAEKEPQLRRKGVPAQLAKGVPTEEWRKVWAAHLGLTTMADEILGKILDELEKMGGLENTCILFTSDHGDNLGQHGMYQKMEMYEEAVKVPMVWKIPGERPGRYDGVVSHLDVMPTLLEAVGISCGGGDGISLLPVIRGEAMPDDRIVFAQYSGNPGYGTIRRAAVSRRFKYVYDSGHEHELYDLERDPSEMHNVADRPEYREILESMYTACRKYHIEHNDFFGWE